MSITEQVLVQQLERLQLRYFLKHDPALVAQAARESWTHNAYGFPERLQKHGGKAAAQRIAVLDGQWADLALADDLMLTSDQVRATVDHLRSLVSEGEVTIEASALWFPTGRQLLDYVHAIAVELPRNEVEP